MRGAVRVILVVVGERIGPVCTRAVIGALLKELRASADGLMVAVIRVCAFVVDVF